MAYLDRVKQFKTLQCDAANNRGYYIVQPMTSEQLDESVPLSFTKDAETPRKMQKSLSFRGRTPFFSLTLLFLRFLLGFVGFLLS